MIAYPMSRPLRIEYPGALYHVTARGNARRDIVEDDGDRHCFVDLLAETVLSRRWRLYAYCLMDNHYHLLVETPEPNLSRGMRQLNGVFTQRTNRRHGRVGHVFQGRYKSILVEREAYLLELCRYTVLNPVRAGLAACAGEWRWSSYPVTADLRRTAPAWLARAAVLDLFGGSGQRYRRFVEAGLAANSPWENLIGQIYLGGAAFVAGFKTGDESAEVPRRQRRPAPKPLACFKGGRDAAMVRAYATGDYTLAEIARHFGVHYSTVSRAVTSSRTAN